MFNVDLQREIDLDYYWRRTSGFIAGMVWPSVAIGYNEVNNTGNAALFFKWAYGSVRPPFNVVTEEYGGAGCANFLTGAGEACAVHCRLWMCMIDEPLVPLLYVVFQCIVMCRLHV